MREKADAKVHVQLVDVEAYDAAIATISGTPRGKNRDDHLGVFVTVVEEWALIKVPFTGVTEQGYGDPVTTGFNPKELMGVQFQASANQSVDLWVDDIAFYE